MTDKERIVAEIERLYKEWEHGTSAEAKYRCEAYKELLETINSMGAEDKPKFNVGDVVMRLDGDGRPHRIVSIEKINSMNGTFFYRYNYADGGCDGMDLLLDYYKE